MRDCLILLELSSNYLYSTFAYDAELCIFEQFIFKVKKWLYALGNSRCHLVNTTYTSQSQDRYRISDAQEHYI